MNLFRETLLLFSLNLLDALLTIVWVRSGVATEGNQLLAPLLENGDIPFLAVKVAIGVLAAFVLLRFADRPLTRYGLAAALLVYVGLTGIHFYTGLVAFGYAPITDFEHIVNLSSEFFAILI